MAFCQNCGLKLDDNASFCPKCGTPVKKIEYPESTGTAYTTAPAYDDNTIRAAPKNAAPKTAVNQPRQKKKGGCLKSILSVLGIFFVLIILLSMCSHKSVTTSTSVSTTTSTSGSASSTTSSSTASTVKETEVPATAEPAKQTTNLPLKSIIESGNLQISLNYVKTSGTITSIGSSEPVADGNEVIFAFFEVYNEGDKLVSFSESKVSAYADSVKLDHVEDYFLFTEDGIHEYNKYDIDGGFAAFVPMDFEVAKGWSELTIFYGDYSWTIQAADVSNAAFDKASVFGLTNEMAPTEVGSTMTADKYTIQYDGFGTIDSHYGISGPWVAFEYTITNNGSESLDTSLVGYDMRCYKNCYLTDSASYTVDDNLNGYVNIFNVDEVKPGMSAKIYIAFEVTDVTGNFVMAFDDGYIFNNTIGYVCAQN